jgi:hypothetical protein
VSGNPNISATGDGVHAVSLTVANSGSAIVGVFDSKGASTQLSLNVGGSNTSIALYATAPESIELGANATANYQVAGGTGPYTVTSSATNVATTSVSGSTLTLQARSQAGKASINVVDRWPRT